MNRKKKVISILKKKAKKANAKLVPNNKPRYVTKAEREKMAVAVDAAQQDDVQMSDSAMLTAE